MQMRYTRINVSRFFCIFQPHSLRESIEEVTESIPIPENETQVILTRESFAVAVQEVEPGQFDGLTFSADVANGFDDTNSQLDTNSLSFSETDDAIGSLSLPRTLFNNINTSRNNTRITQSVFLTDSLFLRREKNFSEVGGIILAASVVGNSVSGLDPPIQLNFLKNPVSALKLYIYLSARTHTLTH